MASVYAETIYVQNKWIRQNSSFLVDFSKGKILFSTIQQK